MYKALVDFTDLQDNRHRYEAGDIYPREGHTPSEKRIKQLLDGRNKLGKPVIEFIETDEPKERKPAVEAVEELPKRKKRKLKDDE